MSLPHVPKQQSFNITKSELSSILNDRKTFVNKYFDELSKIKSLMPKKTEELGNFVINKWKIKVVLVNDEFIVLKGLKGGR